MAKKTKLFWEPLTARDKLEHTVGSWHLPHWCLDGHPRCPLLTCTSKVKYFFRFLMIITRKGSLMPRVFFGSAGHVMYVVLRGKEKHLRISHGTEHTGQVPCLSLD